MAEIAPITSYVAPDEPCYELGETNKVLPIAGAGEHRIQMVQVIRGDRVWEYRRDLGPASDFTCPPFILKGAVPLGNGRYDILETVERLQDLADDLRADGIGIPTKHEPTDFHKAYEYIARQRSDAKTGRRRLAV